MTKDPVWPKFKPKEDILMEINSIIVPADKVVVVVLEVVDAVDVVVVAVGGILGDITHTVSQEVAMILLSQKQEVTHQKSGTVFQMIRKIPLSKPRWILDGLMVILHQKDLFWIKLVEQHRLHQWWRLFNP